MRGALFALQWLSTRRSPIRTAAIRNVSFKNSFFKNDFGLFFNGLLNRLRDFHY